MNNENVNKIISAMVVVGFMVAGAILVRGGGEYRQTPEARESQEIGLPNAKGLKPITEDEHMLGQSDARVVIVEYSDTECPFCKVFHGTMHKIVQDTKGKVAWVYRHYPIPELHQRAYKEALATECAWEQGGNNMFWKYTDEVYARTQSNDSLDPNELYTIAGDLGLNVAQFTSCLDSEKYKDEVEADIEEGDKMGVQGTPTSFIYVDGEIVDQIPGAQPYENIMKAISEYLK